jgi:hypothetical protein
MVNEKSIKNLHPAKKGEVRNPSGRPKGALNNADVNAAIVAAIQNYTTRKDGREAITKAITDGLTTRKMKMLDVLDLLIKTLPKEIGLPPGADFTIRWNDADDTTPPAA